jgi:maleylacetoacetate isomerase
MKLYTYSNSSAAFRVRIAMNLKGIRPEQVFVSLIKDGGEHHKPEYRAVNPQELVPTLEVSGQAIGQSLAIVEYLDEVHPTPRLLPRHPLERARVRQIALAIACDMHPVNNLSVRQYLKSGMKHSDEEIAVWYEHFIHRGFKPIEALLANSKETGRYCHGDEVTLADICLVPQVYNARRYKISLDAYPTIVRIEAALRALTAFADAAPEKQPDAA